MRSLLLADFTPQWRNRKSFILILIVPVIIFISWKGLVDKRGGAFVLANCVTVGLTAIGLMGYSNSVARDREKGIFQRLRVAPVAPSSILVSRLCVQLTMIPGTWDKSSTIALLFTIGYAIIFSVLGIRWFRWNSAK